MKGKELIGQLKKLRDVERPKDIRQLTHAVFPGPHCPLFGAMLAIRSIKDASMLVVGTEECTYYTKSTTMNTMFGGMESRCYSVVMNHHDVTFGSKDKIERAFAELMEELDKRPLPTMGHPHGAGGHPHGVGGHTHGAGGHPHGVGGHPHGAGGHPHGAGGHPHGAGGHPHSVGGHPHGMGGHPASRAVFLVSTCLGEIIGDDIDAMAEQFREEYGIHVVAVHTEHFKSENHMPGISNAISACLDMMQDVPRGETVNVLGQRMGSIHSTELYRILARAGVKVGMALPGGCSVGQIETAPSAKVNIVVDGTALKLAKAMKKRFGTPYVRFERFVSPEHIHSAYESLFTHLQLPLPGELLKKREKALEMVEKAKENLAGVRYFYGNTPLPVYESNAFMVSLGMIPLLIQTVEVPEENDADFKQILVHSDPYVVKTANIAPLQYVYDELRPHLYLGHEFALRLLEKGISLVRSDAAAMMLGYEVTEMILTELQRAAAEAKELEKERIAS